MNEKVYIHTYLKVYTYLTHTHIQREPEKCVYIHIRDTCITVMLSSTYGVFLNLQKISILLFHLVFTPTLYYAFF